MQNKSPAEIYSSKTDAEPVARRSGRWFFVGMALVMIATSIAGFLPAIIQPATRRAPLTLLAGVHGIVYFMWLFLYLAQSLLIANRRVVWHRKLGLTSVVLLALMIPLGFTTTTAMVRRGFHLSGDQDIGPQPDGQTLTDAPTATVFNFFALAHIHYSRGCGTWLSSAASRPQAAHAVCEYLAHGCTDRAPRRPHKAITPDICCGVYNSLHAVPSSADRL